VRGVVHSAVQLQDGWLVQADLPSADEVRQKGRFPFETMPSPNFNERPAGVEIDSVVVHCISLPERNHNAAYPVDLFLNRLNIQAHPEFAELQGLEVSSHFIIDRQGKVLQFVSCDKRAWHAGVSAAMGRENFNHFSIGVELIGDIYSTFEPAQYASLGELLALLSGTYALKFIFAHSDIAPARKTDPGPFFRWESFRKPNTYAIQLA
jgi:N-acetyl-anhydromuramoyl-L-alanine amidase